MASFDDLKSESRETVQALLSKPPSCVYWEKYKCYLSPGEYIEVKDSTGELRPCMIVKTFPIAPTNLTTKQRRQWNVSPRDEDPWVYVTLLKRARLTRKLEDIHSGVRFLSHSFGCLWLPVCHIESILHAYYSESIDADLDFDVDGIGSFVLVEGPKFTQMPVYNSTYSGDTWRMIFEVRKASRQMLCNDGKRATLTGTRRIQKIPPYCWDFLLSHTNGNVKYSIRHCKTTRRQSTMSHTLWNMSQRNLGVISVLRGLNV